ncbi:Pre-rRNA-processing protein ESF2 [Xylariaceae sp. FL0594]|nr:Pre-rRNA-processing protein ESF2 [Xylariaceae sp. FL0594]
MPAEKRNHFLDVDDSEDGESQGYNSEAEQIRKGSSKRRKLDLEPESDRDEDDEPLSDDEGRTDGQNEQGEEKKSNGGDDTAQSSNKQEKSSTAKGSADIAPVAKPLTKKNLVATEKAVKRSGVVYISRIPPFMKPGTVRTIFERFGKINRVYLSPEDAQTRARRLQQGQNRKKNFNEGWLEFIRKADAKAAVEALNGTTLAAIGMAKKRSYYRDDIWSLRYLKGFKWHNLTEQIAAETAERQSRMRAEISKSARENKEFVRNIQKAKELQGIQSKAAAKKNKEAESTGDVSSVSAPATTSIDPTITAGQNDGKHVLKFKQASAGKKAQDKTPQAAKRILSQLF